MLIFKFNLSHEMLKCKDTPETVEHVSSQKRKNTRYFTTDSSQNMKTCISVFMLMFNRRHDDLNQAKHHFTRRCDTEA